MRDMEETYLVTACDGNGTTRVTGVYTGRRNEFGCAAEVAAMAALDDHPASRVFQVTRELTRLHEAHGEE
jgi:hypothetical protein